VVGVPLGTSVATPPRLSQQLLSPERTSPPAQLDEVVPEIIRPNFNGTWVLKQTTGLDGFLTALDVGWAKRKVACSIVDGLAGKSKQRVELVRKAPAAQSELQTACSSHRVRRRPGWSSVARHSGRPTRTVPRPRS
jgi:hypothetical protein